MIIALTEMSATRHGGVFCLRRSGYAYAATFISHVRMFPCEGGRHVEDEPAIARAFASGGEETVRSLRRNAHPSTPDCWLHAPTFCLSRLPAESAARP